MNVQLAKLNSLNTNYGGIASWGTDTVPAQFLILGIVTRKVDYVLGDFRVQSESLRLTACGLFLFPFDIGTGKYSVGTNIGTGKYSVGTNDIATDIETSKNIESIIKSITAANVQVATSDICHREDKPGFSVICHREDKPGLSVKIKDRNNSIKKLFSDYVPLIENNNIDSSCLSGKKLLLNRKGLAYLAKNMKYFLSK